MQSFSLIKNELIETIDKSAVDNYIDPKPLKNTLKTLVKIANSQVLSSGSLYSKRMIFDIPKSYDNLAQLYIKATLSTGDVLATMETYFGAKLFKNVYLKTKKGTVLQNVFVEYTVARLDELADSQLMTKINAGLEADGDFSAGSQTVIVPLFFFFSNENAFLKTRDLEQLELECVVNESKESMGMDVDLTSASFELYALYHDTNGSNKFSELTLSKKSIPRVLKGSFNTFEEDLVVCASGSTSAKLLLRCPHPSYVLHVSLVNATTQREQIKTVKIVVKGNTLIEFDYRMNYQFYGQQNSIVSSGTVSLFFSKLCSRYIDSGLVTFSKEMFPCYLEVTFDSLGSDYTLHAFEEYRTNFPVNDYGEIHLSNDIKDSTEGLDQVNSSTSRFN